jgi:hypothetical protein
MSGSGSGRWLDEDDPSLVLNRGLELTDRERGSTLSTAWTGRTDDIVDPCGARLWTVSAECREPPAGFEPATYALRGRRETAHSALPAPTAPPTALNAPRDLGERFSCPTACPTTLARPPEGGRPQTVL